MTRFEELKAKHDKKQITIDEALELLNLYKAENDYLRNLVATTRPLPTVLGIPPKVAEDIICLGLGYFARDILR